jgi:hypothetical protein
LKHLPQDIDSWVLGVILIYRDETMIGIFSRLPDPDGMNVTKALIATVIDFNVNNIKLLLM